MAWVEKLRLPGSHIPASNAGADLIARFCNESADHTLHTLFFAPVGSGRVRLCPHKKEPRDGRVVVHASTSEAAVRIDKNAFRAWLLKNKLSIAKVERDLRVEFGARTARLTLGGGTKYSQRRSWVLQIPLSALARESDGKSVSSVAPAEYAVPSAT